MLSLLKTHFLYYNLKKNLFYIDNTQTMITSNCFKTEQYFEVF